MGLGHFSKAELTINNRTGWDLVSPRNKDENQYFKPFGTIEKVDSCIRANDASTVLQFRGKRHSTRGGHVSDLRYIIDGFEDNKWHIKLQVVAAYYTNDAFFVAELVLTGDKSENGEEEGEDAFRDSFQPSGSRVFSFSTGKAVEESDTAKSTFVRGRIYARAVYNPSKAAKSRGVEIYQVSEFLHHEAPVSLNFDVRTTPGVMSGHWTVTLNVKPYDGRGRQGSNLKKEETLDFDPKNE